MMEEIMTNIPPANPHISSASPTAAPLLQETAPALIPKTATDPLVGKLIDGKYRILMPLFPGSVSRGYMVKHEHTLEQWGMKVIDKEQAANTNFLQAIRDHVCMQMRLNHPAIPRIADIFEDSQYIYIIYEHIIGEDLNLFIRKNGIFQTTAAIDLAIQLCDVLHYLHTQDPPCVYQGMYPGNITLQPNGQLKINCYAEIPHNLIQEKFSFIPNRGYSAPEQFCGKSDIRSDIYGLGMTLYYLLTGVTSSKPPYTVPPIRDIHSAFPRKLEQIILKCTHRNPEDRFQSCAELKKELQRLQNYSKKDSGLFNRIFRKKQTTLKK